MAITFIMREAATTAVVLSPQYLMAAWMVGISPIGYMAIGYHPFVVGDFKVGISCI